MKILSNLGSTVIRDAKGTHWKKKEAIGSRINLKEALRNKRKSKEKGKTLTKIVIYFLFKETKNKETNICVLQDSCGQKNTLQYVQTHLNRYMQSVKSFEILDEI